ncbi:MAG TPA: hypothetical protein VMA09_00085 [Candidatus Binataceae bacterium]|nr:hypothetical protein [Candidatus Binataceae bacterium]
MTLRSILRFLPIAILPLMVAACSTANSQGDLRTGMTPDETVAAMGQPDLTDNVADPNHSGASVLRYTWIDQGKSAIFGSDNKLASVQNVDIAKKVPQQEDRANLSPNPPFDPINTPLNYLFFPVKAGFTYLGAGLNCVGGGECRKPQIAPPS